MKSIRNEINPDAAANLSRRIEATVAILRQFPRLGRAGKRPGTRELIITDTSYILVYRLQPTVAEIVDVRHTARKS